MLDVCEKCVELGRSGGAGGDVPFRGRFVGEGEIVPCE